MTDGLVVWLRTQLDEDERTWQPTLRGPKRNGKAFALRMLREVDAKRRILDAHAAAEGAEESEYDGGFTVGLLTALRLLALPYAGRPGYRPEWVVDGVRADGGKP